MYLIHDNPAIVTYYSSLNFFFLFHICNFTVGFY
uniref:Uncharacterized protein n=1 Tax=Siphoviridae sp. ctr8v12 TaxID=2825685 RepID=A0A8S5QGC8_9CAUD|nr:MAG TPA: hypothetical protein [Siphoviridae sp. ctr8v12]